MSARPVAAAGRKPAADRGLAGDRAGRDPSREHDRADAELQGRVAEHLLGVEGQDERHADRDGADQDRQGVRAGQGPGAEDAQRHQRRGVARLDQREGGDQHGRAGERQDCPYVAPAGAWCLDDRVDEQDQRAGDGERPGRVVASPGQRGPALAQQHGRQRERGQPDRGQRHDRDRAVQEHHEKRAA